LDQAAGHHNPAAVALTLLGDGGGDLLVGLRPRGFEEAARIDDDHIGVGLVGGDDSPAFDELA
jgi:hypothetical protein